LAGQSVLAGKVLEALTRMMAGQGRNGAAEVGTSDAGHMEDVTKQGKLTDTKLPKDLTPRELEICGLLTKGYSNTELAKELFLAEGTVKNYMMNIYDKFDIHDRTALVLFLKDIIA